LCGAFEVSVSGYYDWQQLPYTPKRQADARLAVAIKAAHERSRQSYGPRRLQAELAGEGIHVGVHRIMRIRRERGIRCKQVKKFKATTNSRHALPVAENLLHQDFTATQPNQAWVTDITYIPTGEGWLYLAGHKDLFSGEIVGHAMAERMTKNLVSESLFRAVTLKKPEPGLIHHSDRGGQYCAEEYQRHLAGFKMLTSMSRKGNCYDNAPIESFWGVLKNELIYHRKYATREEAKKEITEYIEIFYNRQRRQKRLGYLAPAAFLKDYLQTKYRQYSCPLLAA
jgi:putative transposase